MEMTSASRSSSAGRRLWHIVRLLFLGFSKNKLMVDLDLLLKRGKIAGKALTQLLVHHHQHHHHHHRSHRRHQYHEGGGAASMYSALTCRSMDPDLAFYNPREVEFSCSNTPSYPTFRRHRRRHRRYDDDEDDAAFAKALDILFAEPDIDDDNGGGVEEEEEDYFASAAASTSPAIWKSPSVPVRQLRVTDSPFLLKEEEGEADGRIDQKSEEFIKRFHEQLRLQQTISPVAAPEYMHHRRRRNVPLMMGGA